MQRCYRRFDLLLNSGFEVGDVLRDAEKPDQSHAGEPEQHPQEDFSGLQRFCWVSVGVCFFQWRCKASGADYDYTGWFNLANAEILALMGRLLVATDGLSR